MAPTQPSTVLPPWEQPRYLDPYGPWTGEVAPGHTAITVLCAYPALLVQEEGQRPRQPGLLEEIIQRLVEIPCP